MYGGRGGVVPTTAEKYNTEENDQEIIKIIEHIIYAFYIHL